MLLMAMSVLAQKAVVSGIVINGTTNQPVSGASVAAEGVTVVTNEDGFFTLKSDKALETIVVSHLGFRSKRLAVNGLPSDNLKIRLEPTAIQLREVLVTGNNPYDLVRAAINKIPQNYSLVPELYRCFYRETAMKRQHYICVAEGVADMYKTGYKQSNFRDKVAISKQGRRVKAGTMEEVKGDDSLEEVFLELEAE